VLLKDLALQSVFQVHTVFFTRTCASILSWSTHRLKWPTTEGTQNSDGGGSPDHRPADDGGHLVEPGTLTTTTRS